MREPVVGYPGGVTLPISAVPLAVLEDIVAGRVDWTPDAFETDRACTVAIVARYLRDHPCFSGPGSIR